MDRDKLVTILGWAAFAFACSAFVLPVVNPDVFWHLSAGKYTVSHLAPPRTDFLSWPLAGSEWVDFEWLTQVFYYLLHEAGGFRALQAFKALLLALTLLAFRSTVLLYGRSAALPLALPFFAAAIISNCDLRPENFTLLFFALTLYFLERSRLGSAPRGPAAAAAVFVFFALWTNLHAGYLYGLALIGLYAAGEGLTEQLPWIYGKGPFARPQKSLQYLKGFFVGLAASLANPYGWKIYAVIANHQEHIATLQEHIQEWSPFSLDNAYQWPYALTLGAAFGAAAYFLLRRRHVVYQHIAALLFFAWASAAHQRHIPFFVMTALPFALALPWEGAGPRLRRALWPAAAALAAGLLWFYYALVWPQYGAAPRVHRWSSDGLADFLKANSAELSGLRLYNHWGWGGWLGWELGPAYRPFIDGRYLFHDKIPEVTGLSKDARNWTRLIDRYEFDLMLVKLDEPAVPVKQRLADGTEEFFWRPAYMFYLPRRDWAVVYWDRAIAALVRRTAAPPGWLQERELRWLRPGDGANLSAPLLAGEIPLAALRRERDIMLGWRRDAEGYAGADAARRVEELEALCAAKGARCAR